MESDPLHLLEHTGMDHVHRSIFLPDRPAGGTLEAPEQAGLVDCATRRAMACRHAVPWALYLAASGWRTPSRPLFQRLVDSGAQVYPAAAPAFLPLWRRLGRCAQPLFRE